MVSHHCLYMTRWEMPFQCEILNGLQNDVNEWYRQIMVDLAISEIYYTALVFLQDILMYKL